MQLAISIKNISYFAGLTSSNVEEVRNTKEKSDEEDKLKVDDCNVATEIIDYKKRIQKWTETSEQ